jgi:cell division septal protein FtsQ
VRPAAIEARVRALPYVDECQVTTVFPDTVNVEITERTAYATVLVQNRLFTIDREGRVLSELAPGERGVGPLITSLPGPPTAEPGHSLDCAPLREALAVWEAFSSSDVATVLQLSELAAIHENDIRMYCENLPYEIRWGRGVYAEQADRLDALWRAKGGRLPCSQYLDLRFGRDLVCK